VIGQINSNIFLLENLEGRDHRGDEGLDGRILLKWVKAVRY
jgi:hypothetical protein